MQVKNLDTIKYSAYNESSVTTVPNPCFKGGVQTIKHFNLGMLQDGIIGKVRVFKKNGQEAFLDVVKSRSMNNEETYFLRDSLGKTIGEMDIKIKKISNYDRYEFPEDPSHVFVEYLRNYSNPNTPYYVEGLEEYKQVGTRLIQIAQRRSDECLCNGNIQLVAKNQKETLAFYEKLGFKQPDFVSPFVNQYKMYLPPSSKEPLSRITGGL